MSVQAVHSRRTWMYCLWRVTAMASLAFLDLTLYSLPVPVSALLPAVVSGPAAWRRQGAVVFGSSRSGGSCLLYRQPQPLGSGIIITANLQGDHG